MDFYKSLLLSTLLLLVSSHSAFADREMVVKVVSVYDGDTVKIDMPSLPEPLNRMSIRLFGIDTPEQGFRAKCEIERQRANQAKNFLVEFIGERDEIVVHNFHWDMQIMEVFLQIGFIPLNVSDTAAHEMTVFVGYCEKFRELIQGEIIPEYRVLVTRGEDGVVSATLETK